MGLFEFRSPGREDTGAIRFVDENGPYSLADLLDGVWIHLTNPKVLPDWTAWYCLLRRLASYGCVDAAPGAVLSVSDWPTCPYAAGLASSAFSHETGRVCLPELTLTIDGLASTKPVLARRLTRMIIHIAEIDRRRDLTAHRLLQIAGLLEGSF